MGERANTNIVKEKQPWFVYIVRCKDTSLYTGITRDVSERIRTHNLGQGCHYTRGRHPVKLLYSEQHDSRSSATKREIEIKKFSRSEKLKLVKNQVMHRPNYSSRKRR
jgi:putative endonuclease